METAIAITLSVIGTLSAVWLGWSARAKEQKKEVKTEVETDTTMKMDIQYIKRGVENVQLDLRDQARKTDDHAERLTRVEESSKQAHKRIDRFEAGGGKP